uniref:CRIB domain-containing protein n=1 Tax=Leersia perrieri TaxID=77586 RepID=A0A0D9WTB2_9ORYZ
MEIKMKGIFKGLKMISQIFALQKEHEMEIGCPTDVRHVSHIGVGTSDACPSWVRISYLIAGRYCPNFEQPPRTMLPREFCPDNSGQDIPRGPKNPRRKKTSRASSFSSSASSFLSRSRSSTFTTACGDFSLRSGLQVA